MDALVLEINLISAQGLRPLSGVRRLQAYAVIWIDPAVKLRTLVDRDGGENPTWNDKFVFRVPAGFLADDSSSAVNVEIYGAEGWFRPDSLVGSVRLLLGNLRLLSRRRDRPVFDVVGIRRPSGRLHGVLNVGATILKNVSSVASEALLRSAAIGYRDLMEGVSSKSRRLSLPAWAGTSPLAGDRVLKENNRPLPSQAAGRPVKERKKPLPLPASDRTMTERKKPLPSQAASQVLKERNQSLSSLLDDGALKEWGKKSPSPSRSGLSVTSVSEVEADGEEMPSNDAVMLCSLFPRKIHLSPSDSNLAQLLWASERTKD